MKEEKVSMREEFIKIYRIKDPNAKVWKIRTSILGNCIQQSDLGELIATPEEITLKDNLKILTKKTVRPQDKD